jgi:3',5'-cyclic AMP phosphodiesterase CpdA
MLHAKAKGADHFVVSGDLTEIGTQGQFETLAEILDETKIEPERITLVAGNHDAYTEADAFLRALVGPLRPYAASSAFGAGACVELPGVFLRPMNATMPQAITRSRGAFCMREGDLLERFLSDPHVRKKPTLAVLHHPPYPRRTHAWDLVDGLCNWQRLFDLLLRFAHTHILHGHLHESVDRPVSRSLAEKPSSSSLRARIFGAPATVEDRDEPRVRFYDVIDGSVIPVAS